MVDLLSVLGVMLGLPKTLLGLTLLAWGNCLGDMNANVAMTKKGFGEMAITGCMAGPVFNVLMGLGLSTLIPLSKDLSKSITFSLYDSQGELNSNAVLAVALIIAEMIALVFIYFNSVGNQFHVAKPLSQANLVIYAVIITILVVYTLL